MGSDIDSPLGQDSEDAYVSEGLRQQDVAGRAICAMLIEKCPLEIREEVYRYLVSAEAVYTSIEPRSSLEAQYNDLDWNNYLTTDRLGPTVAREVAIGVTETWFSVSVIPLTKAFPNGYIRDRPPWSLTP
ncbi:hypothetical protein M011DRAFT_455916 [Sporormia fimetaria CBS 119925]|uniref:Uncharacterized protein n=1 Tax=Sporormia fimetaria CBS 119925 TaxID=1340428 RepID=A0A6A6VLC5_9PLEO|nr:hypothetical protein M011DRAFT_455916 [Sporormia fimetaria CBS 119925]